MFGKTKKEEAFFELLDDILSVRDDEMVIIDNRTCKILFANIHAFRRMGGERSTDAHVLKAYGCYFNDFSKLLLTEDENGLHSSKVDLNILDKNGRHFVARSSPLKWMDGVEATAIVVTDVENTYNESKTLSDMVYIDQLTGIPNRRKFYEDFETLTSGLAGKYDGVIAMFDLDEFKMVNDLYGHNAGDLMLQLLVDHITSIPGMEGHVYRLGGDEFVFLFFGEAHPDETVEQYYRRKLSQTLKAYTMPNIEVSCTLSMGVARIPEDGVDSSELMRRADIAMYSAKAAGKNRLEFFNKEYDGARKFSDNYITMQPIFDTNNKTFAYEILGQNMQKAIDAPESCVSLFDYSIDSIGLDSLTGNERYIIGLNTNFLNEKLAQSLPKSAFIILISERDPKNIRNMESHKKLKALGFSLALDNAHKYKERSDLTEMADYMMVDFNELSSEGHIRLLAMFRGKTFVAKNIQEPSQHAIAKAMGYNCFHGQFFSQTVTKKSKNLEPLKSNFARLLKLCSNEDFFDFDEIAKIIASDVALSYKVLLLLNSASVGLRYKISSIDRAVAFLGEEKLRKWLALLALRGISANKPLEMVRVSLIRARFCEQMAHHFSPRRNQGHMFLLGMFSIMDVAMDMPFEQIFEELPVHDDISKSLTGSEGVYSDAIPFMRDYENGNWGNVSDFADKHNISSDVIYRSYLDAVIWCNGLMGSI